MIRFIPHLWIQYRADARCQYRLLIKRVTQIEILFGGKKKEEKNSSCHLLNFSIVIYVAKPVSQTRRRN